MRVATLFGEEVSVEEHEAMQKVAARWGTLNCVCCHLGPELGSIAFGRDMRDKDRPVFADGASWAMPWITAGLYTIEGDRVGSEVEKGEQGHLVIQEPTPCRFRTVWGDVEHFGSDSWAGLVESMASGYYKKQEVKGGETFFFTWGVKGTQGGGKFIQREPRWIFHYPQGPESCYRFQRKAPVDLGASKVLSLVEAEDGHAVGPVRPATEKHDPSIQKFAQKPEDSVLAAEWKSFYDLIPNSDAPWLRSMDSSRTPLTFKGLKQFIVSPAVEVLGLGRTDRLCTIIPNGPESAVCFFAFALRCTYAPLDLFLTRPEFEFEFLDLPAAAVVLQRPSTLVKEEEKTATANALTMAQEVQVPKMLELTPKRDTAGLFSLSRHPQGPPLTGEPFGDPTASVKRSDLALVLHTSGTTKKPKIVPLTHENICSGCQCIMSTIQCGLGDVNINIMPLFHIHGLIVNINIMPLFHI